jgi:CDP-diacylglycerol--glycerol-3-phosphate 3-phosphatidyltransferase
MIAGKVMTPSNFLSLSRLILLLPIYSLLRQNTPSGNLWALVFMAVAVVTDFLDGFLARRLNQISDLGKVLDPVADKICIVAVVAILSSPQRENPLPFWFLLVIIIRDAAILLGGYLVYRRIRFVTSSNIWGKSTSAVLALMLIVYVMQTNEDGTLLAWLPDRSESFMIWLSLCFMTVSTVSYARRFYQLWGARRKFPRKAGVFDADRA